MSQRDKKARDEMVLTFIDKLARKKTYQKPQVFWGKFARFSGAFLNNLPGILRKWPEKKLRIFFAKKPLIYFDLR